MLTYVDASAFVKLFTDEPQSDPLDEYLTGRDLTSSALLRTEARRAVRHLGVGAVEHAATALGVVTLLDVSDEILDRAGMLDPRVLRSLDTVHVATAMSVADDLDALVTYDARMQHAARVVGLPVESPA